jgi:two-component system chemotaxis response regulator CheB
MRPRKTRVVVADDSRFMRSMLPKGLEKHGFDVVGVAVDGDEALRLCRELRPDVITLDLAMPGTDGIAVLRALRDQGPKVPVVVVSAFSPAHGARAVDALAEGAVELAAKQAVGGSFDTFLTELVGKLDVAAASTPCPAAPPRPAAAAPSAPSSGAGERSSTKKAVVIAVSTGGPKALAQLMPELPSRLGEGLLIVQHMPPGFTSSLAERLDKASKITVREAKDGDRLEPGVALLAPGGSHVRLEAGGMVRLSDDPPVGGLRPRADISIVDAAGSYGDRTLLVVLTGMGRDGLDGAGVVKKRGGRVLAEAESTCTVYGMPRAVVEAGLADAVLPLTQIAGAIAAEAGA